AAARVPSHGQPLGSVLRISGPADAAIRALIADVFVTTTADEARAVALETGASGVTLDGDVFRGAHRVEGGVRGDSRSILTTKREIKELRERAQADEDDLARMREEADGLDLLVAAAESSILSLQAELHRQEKAMVGF